MDSKIKILIDKIFIISNTLSIALGSLLSFLLYSYLKYSVIPRATKIIGKHYIYKFYPTIPDNTQIIFLGIFFLIVIFIFPPTFLVKINEVKNAKLFLILEILSILLIISLIISIVGGKFTLTTLVLLFMFSSFLMRLTISFFEYFVDFSKKDYRQ